MTDHLVLEPLVILRRVAAVALLSLCLSDHAAGAWAAKGRSHDQQPKAGRVVAMVAGTPITMASFEHWLTVTVDLSPEIAVGAKKVRPVIPKPPGYTACVTQLSSGKPETSKSKLETQCEKEYLKLAGKVLGFLITSDWVLAEAAHLNMTVSESEVQARLEEAKAKQYPSVEQFNTYLVSSGETVADLLWRTRVELLQAEISQSVTAGKGQSESKEALTAFQGEFLSRWREQTSCSTGYVMNDCKQYENSGSHA